MELIVRISCAQRGRCTKSVDKARRDDVSNRVRCADHTMWYRFATANLYVGQFSDSL